MQSISSEKEGINHMAMKTVLIALLLALATSAWTQPKSSVLKFNGERWQGLTGNEKAVYVAGIAAGVTLVTETSRTVNKQTDVDNTTNDFTFYVPTGLTIGEIVRSLDIFYGDPLNREIPVMLAQTALAVKTKKALSWDDPVFIKLIEQARELTKTLYSHE